jgi:hypothetical protein
MPLRKTNMSVDNVKARTRNFLQAYKWLLSDFVRRAGRVLGQVTLLAALFIMCRIFIFSSIVQLIKSIDYTFLSGQRDLELYPGYPFGLATTTGLAWGLVMLTATVGYLFYRSVFTSTHAHMRGLFERLLLALSSRPALGRPIVTLQDDHTKVLSQVATHVRLVNVLSRILLFSIFESLSVLLCLCILLWLHIPTTLVLLGGGLLFMPLYYYLSLEGIRNRRKLRPANRELTEVLRDFEADVTSPTASPSELVQIVMQDRRVDKAFRLFQVQRLIVFKSEYAGWFLLASVTVICISWIYYLSIQNIRISDWYFGIFLVMMYSLVRTLRSVVSSNRFLDSAIFCRRILENNRPFTTLASLENTTQMYFKRDAAETIELCPGHRVVIEASEGRNMFALKVAAGQLHTSGNSAVHIDLLPFSASSEEIYNVIALGRWPIFEAISVPDMDALPAALKEFARDRPLLIFTRKRLNLENWKSPPELVLTIAGTKLMRVWTPDARVPFKAFDFRKSGGASQGGALDDEELL